MQQNINHRILLCAQGMAFFAVEKKKKSHKNENCWQTQPPKADEQPPPSRTQPPPWAGCGRSDPLMATLLAEKNTLLQLTIFDVWPKILVVFVRNTKCARGFENRCFDICFISIFSLHLWYHNEHKFRSMGSVLNPIKMFFWRIKWPKQPRGDETERNFGWINFGAKRERPFDRRQITVTVRSVMKWQMASGMFSGNKYALKDSHVCQTWKPVHHWYTHG